MVEESREEPEASPRPRAVQRRQKEAEAAEPVQNEEPIAEVVDESILPDEAPPARHLPSSAVKNARSRLSTMRNTLESSPRKRKSGDVEQGGEPELRRKIGELTKKQEALESKYRNLREIGVVEANTNMEKLRKQCETVTTGKLPTSECSTSGLALIYRSFQRAGRISQARAGSAASSGTTESCTSEATEGTGYRNCPASVAGR